MRTTFLFIICVQALLACHKDENPGPVVLGDLHLTWSLDSIPVDALSGHRMAVFVNDSGVERKLTITYQSGQDSLFLDTLPYKGDWIDITYTDPLDAHLYLQIHTSIIYKALDKPDEILYIRNANTYSGQNVRIYFDHGKYEAFNRFFEELLITGTIFHKVHGNKPETFVNDDREVFYTSAEGVVGFREADGVLWGWKRWE